MGQDDCAPADVRECGDYGGTPGLALACAALLPNHAQRDRILWDALLSAAAQEPEFARGYHSQVCDKPWLTDAGFFPLFHLARPFSGQIPAGRLTACY